MEIHPRTDSPWWVRAVDDLAHVGDADDLLLRLLAAVVPGLADWGLVDAHDEPDLLRRLGVIGMPPAWYAGGGHGTGERSGSVSSGLLARIGTAPRPGVMHLDRAALVDLRDDGDPRVRLQADLALRAGAHDLVIVRLQFDGLTHGVLTLARTAGAFSAIELAEVEAVAIMAALRLQHLDTLRAARVTARNLQIALLPPLPAFPGLALAARYSAADASAGIGGDWYDAFPIGAGLGLVIGDVVGHDTVAATRMAQLSSLVRGLAADSGEAPGEVLARVDRVLDTLDGGWTATCVHAQLATGPDGPALRWSNAGHPPPLHLRDGRVRLLEEPEADLLLGLDPTAARQTHTVALQADDVVVFYTDGVVERAGADIGVGIARAADVLAGCGADSLESVARRLLDLGTPRDDGAVLAVRVTAPGPSGPARRAAG